MFEEINTDYAHKYDVLRILVLELVHMALKRHPSHKAKPEPNAAGRITTLFLELLERQFPIDDSRQRMNLRTPAAFAQQLSIHVNHLNKALKETTQKPTSAIIQERILQEAKILLKHSALNISEIAYALGFNEAAHFNKFFKQHQAITPSGFRNA